MWDQLNNWSSLWRISPLIAVGTASLLGSGHCLAMCGPILMRTSERRWLYHLGRLVAYVSLGVLAGWIGETLFPLWWVNLVSTILLVSFFLVSAYRAWLGASEIPLLPRWASRQLKRPLGRLIDQSQSIPLASFGVGLFSGLLPCGWLHTFVAAAIATGNPLRGGLVLLVFWAGTVPALAYGTTFLRGMLSPIGKRYPATIALLLLLGAISTAMVRAVPLIRQPEGSSSSATCHDSHSSGYSSSPKQ